MARNWVQYDKKRLNRFLKLVTTGCTADQVVNAAGGGEFKTLQALFAHSPHRSRQWFRELAGVSDYETFDYAFKKLGEWRPKLAKILQG